MRNYANTGGVWGLLELQSTCYWRKVNFDLFHLFTHNMTSLRIHFSLSPSGSVSPLSAGGRTLSVLAGLSHTLYCGGC